MAGITFYIPLFRPFQEGDELSNKVERKFKQGSPLTDIQNREYTRPQIGVPAQDNLIVGAFSFNDRHVEAFTIPSAIMTVQQRKNIVMTNVVGRNGSIKQYVSDGDYDIEIRATLVLDNVAFPQIQDMVEFCSVPVPVSVTSDFLLYFGIQTIVISSFKYNQKQAHDKIIQLEITAHSDEPINLLQYADD